MYDLVQSYGYQYTLYSGLQPCKKQDCGVSQPWIYCTGPNIRKWLQKSTLLAILSEWPRHQPYPLAVPMSSNAISTSSDWKNRMGYCPTLPSFLRAAIAQAVCNAAVKEGLCFVRWTDDPSWIHHGYTQCQLLFYLFPFI